MACSVRRLFSITSAVLVFSCLSRNYVECLMCDRTPPTATVPKTPGDGGFKVTVNGNTNINTYVPGAVYTVRIEGPEDPYRIEKFSGFLLVAESADGIGHSNRDSAGTFKLKDDSLARFSEFCPDAVKQSSEIAKSEIQVLWTAPSLPARCVNFRATVVKSSHLWYMDDEHLTKRLCSENADVTDEGDHSGPCRACEEAKYEMTFEGLWSSLTHPKDFPSNEWKPQFKDLIGASHSRNYRIWDDEGFASEGLRHIAERDDPKYLESELKDQSSNIRTIIKARGIEHTNVQGLKTYAIFRADREHNLISFVSRIDPSPDWFVGVSALNLCTRNGSWIPERTVQLFPWDAGTDNGVRYLDRDMPTMPRHRIRQIVWSNDKNSPFYDADGNMIKPFATLHIQQLRSYKRSTCDQYHGGGDSDEYGEDEFEDTERPDCEMHPWSEYTPCSVNCGKGVQRKYRSYVNLRLARDHGCNRTESKEIFCYSTHGCEQQPTGLSPYDSVPPYEGRDTYGSSSYGLGHTNTMEQYGSPGLTGHTDTYGISSAGFGGISAHHNDPSGDDPCAVSEWSAPSICQDPCGKGIRYQSRTFRNPKQAAMYGCETSVSLRSKERCPVTSECRESSVPSIVTDTASSAVSDPDCEVSRWHDWTPCSVTCGIGSRTLSRVYRYHGVDHSKCKLEMIVIEPCQGIVPTCEIERNRGDCYEPKNEGDCRNNYTRWYFDTSKMKCSQFTWTGCGSSKNNFATREECDSLCGSLKEKIRTRHSSSRGVGATSESSWSSYQSMSPSSGNQFHQQNNLHDGHHFNPVTQPPYSRFTTRAPLTNQRAQTYSMRLQHGQNNIRYQPSSHRSSFSMHGDGPSVDCKMSPWSAWSKCSVSCGRGFKYQTRYVQVYDRNGGKSCPTLLERTRSCRGDKCLIPQDTEFSSLVNDYVP